MKRNKMFIRAYCNFNLGDDLFIKILCERYPKTQFLLYAPSEYKSIFKDIPNLTIYSKNNILFRLFNYTFRQLKINLSVIRLIAEKSDGIIHIGGSIFMQNENWNSKIKLSPLVKGKPYFVIGANFGPYTDESFYLAHLDLFKDYTDICFRDNYSYNLFSNLENVRKADDVVFQLEGTHIDKNNKNIVISVIKPSFRRNLIEYDNAYYQKIRDIAVHFIQKGYKVTLMSFCENEGDREAVEKIVQIIPDELKSNVEKFYYKTNINEALKVISSSSYVVATRFHSMILGWLYNKPVFPIAYSKKMNNVMNDIGYNGSFINLKDIDSLDSEIVFKGMSTNLVNVDNQVKNSEEHFKEIDKLLK